MAEYKEINFKEDSLEENKISFYVYSRIPESLINDFLQSTRELTNAMHNVGQAMRETGRQIRGIFDPSMGVLFAQQPIRQDESIENGDSYSITYDVTFG